ncbi:MAG: hypothetical protein ACM3W7_10735, partial [Acidobacteriota bacterium]
MEISFAYLVLAFAAGQDAYDGSGAPGVAGRTAGFQNLDGPLPGDGRAKSACGCAVRSWTCGVNEVAPAFVSRRRKL